MKLNVIWNNMAKFISDIRLVGTRADTSNIGAKEYSFTSIPLEELNTPPQMGPRVLCMDVGPS